MSVILYNAEPIAHLGAIALTQNLIKYVDLLDLMEQITKYNTAAYLTRYPHSDTYEPATRDDLEEELIFHIGGQEDFAHRSYLAMLSYNMDDAPEDVIAAVDAIEEPVREWFDAQREIIEAEKNKNRLDTVKQYFDRHGNGEDKTYLTHNN